MHEPLSCPPLLTSPLLSSPPSPSPSSSRAPKQHVKKVKPAVSSSRLCSGTRRRSSRRAMGQEEEAVLLPATVVVASPSWEKQAGKPRAEDRDDMPLESPRKAKAPARRLSVPPPPGRPAVPGSRSASFSRGHAVRPEDDPFLAAYLACTRSHGPGAGAGGGRSGRRNGGVVATQREPNGRRRFTWAALGLGLSCKGSGAAVEQSMVKLSKRPELDPRDA